MATALPKSVLADFLRVTGVTGAFVALALGLVRWTGLRQDQRANTASDAVFIKTAEDALQREFQFTGAKLHELGGSKPLQDFLESGSEVNRVQLEAALLNSVRSAKTIDRVRLIRSDGMELAGVDVQQGRPQVVPQESLQDSSANNFFQESLGLEAGGLYASQLDLKAKRGQVELPYTPMLRMATPVHDAKGARMGVLVINVLAQNLFDRISGLVGNHGGVQILDENGFWLYHRDPMQTWGFMFEAGPSFPQVAPAAWQEIARQPRGQVTSPQGLVTFAHIHPMASKRLGTSAEIEASSYSWIMLTLQTNQQLHAATLASWRLGALQWFLIMMMLAPGSWLYVSIRKKQATAIEELARSERRFAALTESMPDAILTVDAQERIVAWNRSSNQLFGLKARNITGMPLSWLLQNTKPRGFDRLLSMPPGETREMIGVRAEGSRFPIEVTAGHWEDAGSRFTSLIARDTTKKAEAARHEAELRSQLDQAHKLESVGQLASGIAHEINTPTQFVGDNTRFLKESFADVAGILTTLREVITELEGQGSTAIAKELRTALEEADADFLEEEIPKALDQSIAGLDRVARIVRAMKEFAHPGQDAMAPADLNHCIESTVTVATNEWKYACLMHLDLDASLPPVSCIAGGINQTVLNMIVNASHAIADRLGDGATAKGNIWISTQLVDNHAEIRIRDDGAGIPEDARKRVFDPFFTTKEVGKGSGQGLAIAHDVVTKTHGGTLTFQTEIGVGTTFIIRIPMAKTSSESTLEAEASA